MKGDLIREHLVRGHPFIAGYDKRLKWSPHEDREKRMKEMNTEGICLMWAEGKARRRR